MKKTFVKFLGIGILCAFVNQYSYATENFGPADTTKKIQLASLEKKASTEVVLKAANIVYPEILSGNEEASIDYVEKFSISRKDYLIRTYNRSRKLFPKAEMILKKYNVPTEFKVLLGLESGFNANAVSPAGAVGYWQIMDEVAKEYGLKISAKIKSEKKKITKGAIKKNHSKTAITVDDRKNFNKSTNVAARYLKDRSRNLDNDWLLIAASYNWGVGNVWNAMQRCGKKSPNFWDIRHLLPSETRSYVMNFIAMNVVFNNYEKFSKNTLCFKQVTCKITDTEDFQPIDLTTL